jgi:hypothetical protein
MVIARQAPLDLPTNAFRAVRAKEAGYCRLRSLTVDGQLLTGPWLAAWRRSVAYISQENFLFNQSIRAHLLWCRRHDAGWAGPAPGCLAASASGSSSHALLRNPALLILDEQQTLLTRKASGQCGPSSIGCAGARR